MELILKLNYLAMLAMIVWLLVENFRLRKENAECKILSVDNGNRLILIRSILWRFVRYMQKEAEDGSNYYLKTEKIECYLDDLSSVAGLPELPEPAARDG